MRATFQGSIVALVTPFANGRVDEGKLRELVDFHVAHGTDGIAVPIARRVVDECPRVIGPVGMEGQA